ncbi:MAG TPA: serine hydrolase [Gemmatimonadaceae bacterium]|nr:serine hydrolase [Gemmatimonadaceae bacterium]
MRKTTAIIALALLAACGTTARKPQPARMPPVVVSEPAAPSPGAALDSTSALQARLAVADSIIQAWVSAQKVPGAVLLVARDGQVVHDRAFGYAQLYDYAMHRLADPPAMDTSTMFDLASVTKVMATTFAVMMLVDQGKIDVDAPVYAYLPDFRGVHKDSITVRHLLQHAGGLVRWQPLYYQASNEDECYRAIRDMPLQWGVGKERQYSDLGFMLLGYIIEHVTGEPLNDYLQKNLYEPLGLRHTTFNPKKHGFTHFAATEQGNGYERHMVYDDDFGYDYDGDPTSWDGWRHYVLIGEVNDGNSWYANGGMAGHAGLFSTAADLRILLDLLNARGEYGGRRYISASVIDQFLTEDRFHNYLGWQKPRELPEGSFFHNGFTGTYVLGVPSEKLSIVLLTNRQNVGTDAKGYFTNVGPLDSAVAQAVAGPTGSGL